MAWRTPWGLPCSSTDQVVLEEKLKGYEESVMAATENLGAAVEEQGDVTTVTVRKISASHAQECSPHVKLKLRGNEQQRQ